MSNIGARVRQATAQAAMQQDAEETARRKAHEAITRDATAAEIEKWRTTRYVPRGSLVLVRVTAPGKTEGGIIVPAGVEHDYTMRVLAVGPGQHTNTGALVPIPNVQEGDRILPVKGWNGQYVQQHPDGGAVFLMSEESIACVLDRRSDES